MSNLNLELAASLTDEDLVLGGTIDISWPSSSERLNYCSIKFQDESKDFVENVVSWPNKVTNNRLEVTNGKYYRRLPEASFGSYLVENQDCEWKIVALGSQPGWTNPITLRGANADFYINGALVKSFIGPTYSSFETTVITPINKIITIETRINALPQTLVYGKYPSVVGFSMLVNGSQFDSHGVAEGTVAPFGSSNDIYSQMLVEDNGVPLEVEIEVPGITDYYHALAKAEEVVRTSRIASAVTFKYIVGDTFLEPGDYILLNSNTLNIENMYLKIEEIDMESGYICSVKASRFDSSQLAWNVLDNIYIPPPPLYDTIIEPPQNLVYEPFDSTIEMSVGKLKWDNPKNVGTRSYIVYANLDNNTDSNGELIFDEVGRLGVISNSSFQFFYLPALNSNTVKFGVRAETTSGKRSVMTTTNDVPVFKNFATKSVMLNYSYYTFKEYAFSGGLYEVNSVDLRAIVTGYRSDATTYRWALSTDLGTTLSTTNTLTINASSDLSRRYICFVTDTSVFPNTVKSASCLVSWSKQSELPATQKDYTKPPAPSLAVTMNFSTMQVSVYPHSPPFTDTSFLPTFTEGHGFNRLVLYYATTPASSTVIPGFGGTKVLSDVRTFPATIVLEPFKKYVIYGKFVSNDGIYSDPSTYAIVFPTQDFSEMQDSFNNIVGSDALKDNSILLRHMTDNSVGTAELIDESIVTSKIQEGAIALSSNIISGVLPSDHLGTGTANEATVLHGDGTWKSIESALGGTVTYVGISGASTGLVFNGSPITTSGTAYLGGILNVQSGGTGDTQYQPNSYIKGNGFSPLIGVMGVPGSDISSIISPIRLGNGVADSTKFLRGDGLWSTVAVNLDTSQGVLSIDNGGTGIGLAANDNKSGILKKISSASSTLELVGSISIVTETHGTLPISRGGIGTLNFTTGFLKRVSTDDASLTVVPALSLIDDTTGVLPISRGGTGSPSASGARTLLGTDNAANLTTGLVDPARLGTGVPNNLKYLRGDNVWASPDLGTFGGVLPVSSGGTGKDSWFQPGDAVYTDALVIATKTSLSGNTFGLLYGIGNFGFGENPTSLSLGKDLWSGVLPTSFGGTGRGVIQKKNPTTGVLVPTNYWADKVGQIIIVEAGNSGTQFADGSYASDPSVRFGAREQLPLNNIPSIPLSKLTSLNGNTTEVLNPQFLSSTAISNLPNPVKANMFLNANSEFVSVATAGTVTSIGVSGGTTGLTTSGGPITTNGVITLSGTLNISNGGTGGTTAAAARASLGTNDATNITVGVIAPERLGVGSPDSTKVLHGDGSWAVVSGSGTVTSVNLSGGTTGLAFTGGPITSAGTISLDGTLALASGGTGGTTALEARNNLGLGTSAVEDSSFFATASHTHVASDIVSGIFDAGRLGSGTASATTFLAGDNTWKTISVDMSNLSGTVPVTKGGTGLTELTAGSYLKGDGTNSVALQAGIPTTDLVGTVPTANLGSGTASSSTYLRGDGTWGAISGSSVSGTVSTNNLGSGTADATKYLRGDGSWQTLNIDSLSDAKTTAQSSIGIGSGALNVITGSNNLAIGINAMNVATTTSNSVAIGNNALGALLTGASNTAIGSSAGLLVTGQNNTLVGFGAGDGITTGSNNVALGSDTLGSAGASIQNVAIGRYALAVTTTSANTAVGYGALGGQTTGLENTAVGTNAGDNLTTGSYNTFVGMNAGTAVTTNSNTLIGHAAGLATTATQNTMVGKSAGLGNTSGNNNVFLGFSAGSSTTTGANVIVIGASAAASSATVSNEVTIGSTAITNTRLRGSLSVGNTTPSAGTSGQFLKTAGAGVAPSWVNLAAADVTSGVFATARLGSGTASSTTYLRGDGTWAAVSGGGGSSGSTTVGVCTETSSGSKVYVVDVTTAETWTLTTLYTSGLILRISNEVTGKANSFFLKMSNGVNTPFSSFQNTSGTTITIKSPGGIFPTLSAGTDWLHFWSIGDGVWYVSKVGSYS